jgi:hypothetical protein
MHPVTSSRRSLDKLCNWWRGPDATCIDLPDSGARQTGHETHGLAQSEVDGSDEPSDAGERARAMMQQLKPVIETVRARGGQLFAEVSMAWDPAADTARILAVGKSRAYGTAKDYEKCGTADLIAYYPDRVEVFDYKTTHAGGQPMDATDQLEELAVFAARAAGHTTALIATIEVSDMDARIVDERELDSIELDSIVEDIREELSRPIGPPKPGSHCSDRYCSAITSCPVAQQAITQLVPVERLIAKPYVPGAGLTSAQDARKALVLADMLESIAEALKGDARAWTVLNDGLELEDGRVYRGWTQTTASPNLEASGAMEIVIRAGAEKAIKVKKTMTWTDLTKTLGKDAAGDLRKELEATGCVKTSSFQKFEARKPKREKS